METKKKWNEMNGQNERKWKVKMKGHEGESSQPTPVHNIQYITNRKWRSRAYNWTSLFPSPWLFRGVINYFPPLLHGKEESKSTGLNKAQHNAPKRNNNFFLSLFQKTLPNLGYTKCTCWPKQSAYTSGAQWIQCNPWNLEPLLIPGTATKMPKVRYSIRNTPGKKTLVSRYFKFLRSWAEILLLADLMGWPGRYLQHAPLSHFNITKGPCTKDIWRSGVEDQQERLWAGCCFKPELQRCKKTTNKQQLVTVRM